MLVSSIWELPRIFTSNIVGTMLKFQGGILENRRQKAGICRIFKCGPTSVENLGTHLKMQVMILKYHKSQKY